MTSNRHVFARIASCLFLLLTLGSPVAHGVDLFDNLNRTPEDVGSVSTTAWTAQRFTTDNQQYDLTQITLLLARPSGSGELTLQLWGGTSLVPSGGSLGTLTRTSAYSTTSAQTTFSAAGLTLSANSNYWIVAIGANSTTLRWSYTANNTGSGVGFQQNWSDTFDSGGTWSSGGIRTNSPYIMKVTATAVPEPGTVVLMAVSTVFGIAIVRRRKK